MVGISGLILAGHRKFIYYFLPEGTETGAAQAIANQGALGMYCNSLMLNKALYGRLPGNGTLPNPPAPLEDIIDSAVKTGADASGCSAQA